MLVYGHPPNPLSETLPNDSQMTPKAAAIQVDKSPDQEKEITLSTDSQKPCQPSVRNPSKIL